MVYFWGAVIVLLLFLAFTDAWYFVRAAVLCVFTKARKFATEDDIYRSTKLWGIVLPSDIDVFMHMNNSRYARECDFGRHRLWFLSGLQKAFTKVGAKITVNAMYIRYRRSLTLFQTFELHTRFACWEEDAFYIEQKFVTKDGFVAAIAYVKMPIRGAKASDMFTMVSGIQDLKSRPAPPEIATWKESIALSSKKLRENQ